MPISLAEVLQPNCILVNAVAINKKRVLEIISQLVANHLKNIDYKVIFEAFINRERLSSTAIDDGVAMPHISLDEIEKPIATFITLKTPIDFGAIDMPTVDLLFALIIPKQNDGNNKAHLQLLNDMATQMKDKNQCQRLRKASTITELYQLLTHDYPSNSH